MFRKYGLPLLGVLLLTVAILHAIRAGAASGTVSPSRAGRASSHTVAG
jgi:uncharacterized membrane protein (DUF441 family)